MNKPILALSAGHYRKQNEDPNITAGRYNKQYNLYEHDICDVIVKSAFNHCNTVVPHLIYGTLFEKVKQITELNCNFAIEVHLNYFEGQNPERVDGTETVYETNQSESKKLATLIQGQLVFDMNLRDRGILSSEEIKQRRGWKQFYFFDKMDGCVEFLQNIPIISVLTEIGFLSNNEFARRCSTLEIQPLAGRAIANAIDSYVKNLYTGD